MGLAKIVSSGKSGKNAGNHFSLQMLCACFAAVLFSGPEGAAAAQYRLDYKTSHSIYGDIDTYTNFIETDGDTTTVTTTLDIKVSILGVVAYRRNARRVETWMEDRLVEFHGTSRLNGTTIVLSGAAQGDKFVLTLPNGTVSAPASIRIANPWTTKNLNGDTIFSPDDGAIRKARLTDMGETSAQNIRVHEYDIALVGTAKHYQVWFDAAGTPVMFRVFDFDGICTFTLNGPKPSDMLIAERAGNPQQGAP